MRIRMSIEFSDRPNGLRTLGELKDNGQAGARYRMKTPVIKRTFLPGLVYEWNSSRV